MTRDRILAEIRQLERERDQNPGHEKAFNDRITALCDRLKGLGAWKPKKVV